MRANRVYELHIGRARTRDGVDHIEVLEIETGEIALFWDLMPHQTRRMARALRADLAQLEADAFIARWERWLVD